MSFFKPRQSKTAPSNTASKDNRSFFGVPIKVATEEQGAASTPQEKVKREGFFFSSGFNSEPFFKPKPVLRQSLQQNAIGENESHYSEKGANSVNPAVIQKKEGTPQESEAGTENGITDGSVSLSESSTQAPETNLGVVSNPDEPEISTPVGPYWKHEWHTDRTGREALFIWEVGGKRWHTNADRGYAYIREMALKSADDSDYDPRFEQYRRRPRVGQGANPDLDFWFKKTPGWDDKTKADDGTADFQDLAEFSDVPYNKKKTGFYKMAFVFDPLIYEKLEAIKTEKQNSEYIGNTTNYKAFVVAPNGIILHKTPIPTDAQYKQRQASGKAEYILKPNAPLVVLGEGNEQNEGWVYVRAQSGDTGWIERINTGKSPSAKSLSTFDSYTVKKGDMLGDLIKSYYDKYPISTGNDERTIALALYIYNKGRSGSGVYRDYTKYYQAKKANLVKDAVDVWMAETRANYASIELYAGGEVFLPPAGYIQNMRQKGDIEKRPDFVNTMVDSAQVVRGFGDGVNIGFLDAIVDTATDLYNMVKDIFTGELFKQLYEIMKMLAEKGPTGMLQMLKDLLYGTWEEVKAAWNNPNAYERGKYFGEIVGAILLEVVIAVLTYGIGTAIKQSARFAKFISWFPSLNKIKKLPDGEMDRYDEIKKADGKKEVEKNVESDVGESESFLNTELISELKAAGVQFTEKDLKFVAKNRDNFIMFLEKGNPSSGLQHIIDGKWTGKPSFQKLFSNNIDEMVENIFTSIKDSDYLEKIIDSQNRLSYIYKVQTTQGLKEFKIAIGSNGYIVSFIPNW